MNIKPITTFKEKYNIHKPTKKDAKNISKASIGTITGAGAYVGILELRDAFSENITKSMKKVNDSISVKGRKTLRGATNKAFELTNLKEAGVEFKRVGAKTVLNGKNMQLGEDIDDVIDGINAFFDPNINTIFVPKKGLYTAGFHEMGHALNNKVSKISRFIQHNVNPESKFLETAILAIALTKKQRANTKSDENDSKINKCRQFIKNHAPVLAAMTQLPTIFEETMATVRGNALAKEVLKDSPELLKKVKKVNALGIIDYTSVAIVLGIGTKIAITIKDKIQEKLDSHK